MKDNKKIYKEETKYYYVYMLRCEDNSIYTGITTDINRRMNEHFTKDKKCAKYTYNHNAKKLEALWQTENRVLASKLEFHIKSLNHKEKENIINENNIDKYLNEKIDSNKYKRISNFDKITKK